MARPHDLDISDISRILAPHAPALCRELLPDGERHGDLWRCGSTSGERGQSLAVHLEGPRRGKWHDYNGGQFGDLIDLIAATRTNGDLSKALAWARSWLGLSTEPLAKDSAAKIKAQADAQRKRDAAEAARQAAERQRQARQIWDNVRQLTPGDPVDQYLRGRGIDLAALGRAPAALRYAPALTYARGQRFPAMVAAVTDGAARFIAIHRTFLEIHPNGSVTKAPVPDPKKSLGPLRRGSIKLWRGAGDMPWVNMRMGSVVVAGEGIEDSLAALVGAEIALPGYPPGLGVVPVRNLRVIAAVSLDNFAVLDLPAQVAQLVFLAQRDPPGSPAAKRLAAAVAQLKSVGLEVRLLRLPSWPGLKDVNDLVRRIA
jgi:hypothetical protein